MNDTERRFNDQFRETAAERNERQRTNRLKDSIRTYQKLVHDLSDALTDEGGDWSVDGLHEMRCRVANALSPDICPDWLVKFRDPGVTGS